jgi:hypothetical protein
MSIYYTFYCYNHTKFNIKIEAMVGNDLVSYQESYVGINGNATFSFAIPDVIARNPTFTLYGLYVEPGYTVKLSETGNGDAIAYLGVGSVYTLNGSSKYYDLTAM